MHLHHKKGFCSALLVTGLVVLLSVIVYSAETSERNETASLVNSQSSSIDLTNLEELNLSTAQEDNTTDNSFCITPVYPHFVEDLYRFPQDIEVYAKKSALTHKRHYDIQKSFDQHYFSVWSYRRPPERSFTALWPFRVYTEGCSYGENLQLIEESWFDAMLEEADFKHFGKVSSYGITLHFSSLRNFPTQKPLFRDPSLAGEGFPFDYLQNSAVHANEPIFISHYSKDRAWVYVYTSYASGWLPSYSIAFMNKKERKKWMKAKPVYLLKENVALTDTEGHFLFYSRVGMRLSFIKKRGLYTYARAVAPGAFNKPTFVTIRFKQSDVSTEPLYLNQENLTNITADVMKSNYGWGGLYEERDCSSTLRDIYTPFGIWMPRNSRQQSRIGKVIQFTDLNTTAKEELIKEEAIPFETFLHRKGHIMLYLGTYDDNIMILHNMWGIKTLDDNDEEGRIIVGKVVISTLDIGSEQKGYDYNSSLMPGLDRMNIFTYNPVDKPRKHQPKNKKKANG
jgi:hypothetical protein